MQFIFFDYADNIQFVRDDIESGSWTCEEMTLTALFPFHKGKEITRGMRIGFADSLGVFQVFEIRKVRNYEPDHYQEITAESIAISELSNEFFYGEDVTDITPAVAVGKILANTLWSVGNVTATNTQSADLQKGDVWSKVRTIENNWNVLITPRITVGASGITGRYLDIAPNEGTWRGIRLSLEKNADEVGVTIDDSEVYTALYGFGHSVDSTPTSPTDEPPPLTFADVVWTATADHPAKPANQEYIEDPTATALYGRNGRARFGFYQNADITDAETLLEKTWESLQQTNKPRISIDCLVRDLYRMGYKDQPIRLHDKAIVEIRPTGEVYTLDVIKMSVDLLDPTATRVTIGAYIPNIIYIQRDTEEKARGGGGGGRGQSAAEYERQEFETLIAKNAYQITLKASQNDLTTLEGVVQQSSVTIEAQGVTISSILNNVGDGTQVTAATIATSINNGTSGVLIQADRIDIQGIVTALQAENIDVLDLSANDITCQALSSYTSISCASLSVDDVPFTDCITDVEKTESGGNITLTFTTAGGNTIPVTFSRATTLTGAWSGGTYTVTASPQGDTESTSVMLGADGVGTSNNFSVHAYHDSVSAQNIADSEYIYLTEDTTAHVVKARWGSSSGTAYAQLAYTIPPVTLNTPTWGAGSTSTDNTFTVTATNGESVSQMVSLSQSGWSSGSKTVYLSAAGSYVARATVNMPAVGDVTWTWSYPAQGYIQATVVVGGKTYSSSHAI